MNQVKELPHTVKVIGRSNKTAIEIFKFECHVMGIQGHPEYTQDILLHLIDRLLMKGLIGVSYKVGFYTLVISYSKCLILVLLIGKESLGCELKMKISGGACEADKEAWRRICIDFLKKNNR